MKKILVLGAVAFFTWVFDAGSMHSWENLPGILEKHGVGSTPIHAAAPAAHGASTTYADVAPILSQRCVMCHSGPAASADLRLDANRSIQMGGRRGPVVVSGNPEGSELVRRIRGISQPRMPMNGPPWLSEPETLLIEGWIAAGAPDAPLIKTSEEPATPATPGAPATGREVTFDQVAPIFNSRCVKCHSPKGLMGEPPEGILLDSYKAIVAKTERVLVIPGSPGISPLVRSIRGLEKPRMPMDGPPYLDPAEIDLIAMCVSQGARDQSGTTASIPVNARIRLTGTLTASWELDGAPFQVTSKTRLRRNISVGSTVEVRGRVTASGALRASEVRPR